MSHARHTVGRFRQVARWMRPRGLSLCQSIRPLLVGEVNEGYRSRDPYREVTGAHAPTIDIPTVTRLRAIAAGIRQSCDPDAKLGRMLSYSLGAPDLS
jgi:hypothetical protein